MLLLHCYNSTSDKSPFWTHYSIRIENSANTLTFTRKQLEEKKLETEALQKKYWSQQLNRTLFVFNAFFSSSRLSFLILSFIWYTQYNNLRPCSNTKQKWSDIESIWVGEWVCVCVCSHLLVQMRWSKREDCIERGISFTILILLLLLVGWHSVANSDEVQRKYKIDENKRQILLERSAFRWWKWSWNGLNRDHCMWCIWHENWLRWMFIGHPQKSSIL